VASTTRKPSQRPTAEGATRYGSVVKLRGSPGDVCTIPGRDTTRGDLAMQDDDIRLLRSCQDCQAPLSSSKPITARYCSRVCSKRASQKRTGRYKAPIERSCDVCAAPFTVRVPGHRFCSRPCSKEHGRTDKKHTDAWHSQDIPTGTRGALSELRACVDLMSRGFHVFRAMSPSCPCDLVAWDADGRIVRIEVKTASRNSSTGVLYRAGTSRNQFDVACYVTRDEVIYDPPIEEW
jgi:hypothetical protein